MSDKKTHLSKFSRINIQFVFIMMLTERFKVYSLPVHDSYEIHTLLEHFVVDPQRHDERKKCWLITLSANLNILQHIDNLHN